MDKTAIASREKAARIALKFADRWNMPDEVKEWLQNGGGPNDKLAKKIHEFSHRWRYNIGPKAPYFAAWAAQAAMWDEDSKLYNMPNSENFDEFCLHQVCHKAALYLWAESGYVLNVKEVANKLESAIES